MAKSPQVGDVRSVRFSRFVPRPPIEVYPGLMEPAGWVRSRAKHIELACEVYRPTLAYRDPCWSETAFVNTVYEFHRPGGGYLVIHINRVNAEGRSRSTLYTLGGPQAVTRDTVKRMMKSARGMSRESARILFNSLVETARKE